MDNFFNSKYLKRKLRPLKMFAVAQDRKYYYYVDELIRFILNVEAIFSYFNLQGYKYR